MLTVHEGGRHRRFTAVAGPLALDQRPTLTSRMAKDSSASAQGQFSLPTTPLSHHSRLELRFSGGDLGLPSRNVYKDSKNCAFFFVDVR